MEDSREGKGDDKRKDVESQIHTWMREKGKKAMIYNARKYRRRGIGNRGREKQKKGNHIFRACPKRIEGKIPRSYLRPFFTLKPNILAQDQTSSFSCAL